MTVRFKQPVVLPQKFWVAIDFDPGRTKGVYVSYDTETEGKHSRQGLAAEPDEVEKVDFGGDWMVQALLESTEGRTAQLPAPHVVPSTPMSPFAPTPMSPPAADPPLYLPTPAVVGLPQPPFAIGERLIVTLRDGSDPLGRTVEVVTKVDEKGLVTVQGGKPAKVAGVSSREAVANLKLALRDLMPEPQVSIRRVGAYHAASPPVGQRYDPQPRAESQVEFLQHQVQTLVQRLQQLQAERLDQERLAKQVEALQFQVKALAEEKQSLVGARDRLRAVAEDERSRAATQIQRLLDERDKAKQRDAPVAGPIRPGERLSVEAFDRVTRSTLLSAQVVVDPDGRLALGAEWGRAEVGGRTIDQAEEQVQRVILREVEIANELSDENRPKPSLRVQIRRVRPTADPGPAPSRYPEE